TLTQTGMGYDSIAATPTAMGGAQRNVGLVAGSYSKRTSQGGQSLEMNTQIAGVDLRFTPEPGASIALLSGLGLLGALGVRRRS
ncbi:MAG: PEP-CTERM sorting domain-containing protein, partial [bacterium]